MTKKRKGRESRASRNMIWKSPILGPKIANFGATLAEKEIKIATFSPN